MKNTIKEVRLINRIEDVPDNPRFAKQLIIDGLLILAITFFSLSGIAFIMYLIHVKGMEF